MAAVVDPGVPRYVYLNIRLRDDYRKVLTYLYHYGDTDYMFLVGGVVANVETPHAVVARYLKKLGGCILLNSNIRFHLVKVIEDVMNYDVVKNFSSSWIDLFHSVTECFVHLVKL